MPDSFRLREEAVLRADLAQLSDSLKALDKQMAQKLATQKRLDMSIAFQHKLMDTLNQRVSTRQQAIDLNVGTKINLYDAKEELREVAVAARLRRGPVDRDRRGAERSSEREGEDGFAVHRRQPEQARGRLAQGGRGAAGARQGQARLARTKLNAPIDGVVQQTAVTTVGQVVTTGQQLAVITPDGGKLQVEALVANLDIGFVKLGQTAVIKVDAFPFTRFGALHGKVVKIARQRSPRTRPSARSPTRPRRANAPRRRRAPGQPESFVFPGDRRARRERDEDRRIDRSVNSGHDSDRRDQDRLSPRHRVPSFAARQDRLGGRTGAVEGETSSGGDEGFVSPRKNG